MTDSPRCSVATAWLHDIDEDPGSKSTVRANPRGEPRDQCTRAITSCASQSRGGVATTRRPRDAASPKACAARDHIASANRYNTHRASKPHDVAAARTLATPRPTDPRAEASRQAWVGTTMPPGVATEGRAPSDDIAARNEHALNKRSRRRCPSNVVVSARRPQPPRTSHAARRTGARSLPRRIPRPKPKETARQLPDGVPEIRRRCSASPAETGETVALPRPNGCPIASGVSPVPAETGASSTVAAFGRVPGCRSRVTIQGRNQGKIHSSCAQTVPGCRRCVTPPAETDRGQQQLRPDGVPACRRCITRFGRNRSRVRNSCAQTIARIPKPLHPPRPKPRRDRRQQHCRSRFTPCGRNREEIDDSGARTDARRSKARHPLQPKPKREPRQQRSDGCPFAEGTSLLAVETAGDAATSVPERVSVCRCHVTPPAETEENAATSTPGRVPACRRNITPSSRNRREL